MDLTTDDRLSVALPYGRGSLEVAVPRHRTTVVSPAHHPAATDEAALLRQALRHPVSGPPLREIVRPGETVAISICDATRPQPRRQMLEAVLDELDGIVRLEDVTVLVATGSHRANTDAELRDMLGDELVDTLRIVNHDARREQDLVWCGRYGADVPVWLNRWWTEADRRITTGFVEPHFFAGFSGGPKLVAPGLAGLETILTLHDAARIGSPQATWAVCEGNPVHDDVRAIAVGTGLDLAFDVVLNHEQRVVSAFAGEVLAMHAAAREHVRQVSMRPVDGLFDIVVTTNAGYPLDQNLYQAVKGMSAAATIVRPGGLILCAAECSDGLPDHGSFRAELEREPTPEQLLASIAARERTVPDQWQVQVLARVLTRARVGVHASGLIPDDLVAAHVIPVDDLSVAVAAELATLGDDARVCVLPEGPQTIPYVRTGTVAQGAQPAVGSRHSVP